MSFINVYFRKGNEQTILMQAKSDMMFAELILKYFQKTGMSEKEEPQFLYNSSSIPYDSCKTLDEIKIRDGAKIDVVLGKYIVGAINI